MNTTTAIDRPSVQFGKADGAAGQYVAPNLFPAFGDFSNETRQRQYILDRLLEMATDGDLTVTDLLGQTTRIRDMIGLILKNTVVDPETRYMRAAREYERTPAVLSDFPITIQCIAGRADTIKFVRCMMPHPDLVRRNISSGQHLGDKAGLGSAVDPEGKHFQDSQPVNVEEHVDYKKKKATLPLWEAWICMIYQGAHCKRAPTLRRQMRQWLYEEVGHPANANTK